ncbi:MAG TPA: universal stress protein [Spirochaetota bacterium]|nr:universal stress protein [Spirochaetota bacterium]
MFKKILYPTDFSQCADNVIPYLKKFKDSGTKEIVVLHVIDLRYTGYVESASWFGEVMPYFKIDLFNTMKEEAEKKLKSIQKKLSPHFKVKVRIEDGVPFKTIIEVAEKERVNLIAIGSHGKSNIEEMLLGSVSEKVIRKSDKPCMVIKR